MFNNVANVIKINQKNKLKMNSTPREGLFHASKATAFCLYFEFRYFCTHFGFHV